MDFLEIQNTKYELVVNQTHEGLKEVLVTFQYNGKEYRHSIFLKEEGNIDYIAKAKERFEIDVKSGKIRKVISKNKFSHHKKWPLVGVCALGALAIIFGSLFIWKQVSNGGGVNPGTFQINFNCNGGSPSFIKPVEVNSGDVIIDQPTYHLTRGSDLFKGWFYDKNNDGTPEEKFVFATSPNDTNATKVTNNWMLTAQFANPEKVTITFNAGEGSWVNPASMSDTKNELSLTFKYGDSIPDYSSVDPVVEDKTYHLTPKDNYAFVGWEANDGAIYSPGKLPKATVGVSYKALFEETLCDVEFYSVDPTVAPEPEPFVEIIPELTQHIIPGKSAYRPSESLIPTYQGYSFLNWYETPTPDLSPEGDKEFDFSTEIREHPKRLFAIYESQKERKEYSYNFAGIGCFTENDTYKVSEGRNILNIQALEGYKLRDSIREIKINGESVIGDTSKYTYTKISDEKATLLIKNATGDVYVELLSDSINNDPTIELTYTVPSETYGFEKEDTIKFEVLANEGELIYVQYDDEDKILVDGDFIEKQFTGNPGDTHSIKIYGNIDTINGNDFDDYGYRDDAYTFGNLNITGVKLFQDLGKPQEQSKIGGYKWWIDENENYQSRYTLFTEIETGDNVNTIPCYLFDSVGDVDEIYLGKNVKRINESAFSVNISDTTKQKYFHLGSNVKFVESWAINIYNYDSPYDYIVHTELKELPDTYQEDWLWIGGGVLILDSKNPPKYESFDDYNYYLNDSEEIILVSYTPDTTTTDLVIPDYINGHPVAIIGGDFSRNSTFEEFWSSYSLTIPSTVREISGGAFVYGGVDSITFEGGPDNCNLEVIGEEAFFCNGISDDLILPNSIKKIGKSAFGSTYFWERLDHGINITLPEEVEYIGDGAFSQSPAKSYVIPKTATYIGSGAFASCKFLESIIIDEENPNYSDCGKNVVYEIATQTVQCGLLDFDLPEETKIIGKSAYSYAEFEKPLEIPNTIEKIDDYAFSQAYIPGLTFEANSSLKYIGYEAFASCSDHSPEGIVGEVILPEGLLYIGEEAFWSNEGCTTYLYIPDSMKSGYIGPCAFMYWMDPQRISSPTPDPGAWSERWSDQCWCTIIERK